MLTAISTTSRAALRAPFATIESRRPARSPLAVVFAPTDGGRAELLLVIDPIVGRCQGEYYSRDFDGEGVGEVTMRRLTEYTHVVIGQFEVRGFNTRTEQCQILRVDAAVSWSVDPITGDIDVAGTALVLGPDEPGIVRMEALTGHSFNRFESPAEASMSLFSPVAADQAPAA